MFFDLVFWSASDRKVKSKSLHLDDNTQSAVLAKDVGNYAFFGRLQEKLTSVTFMLGDVLLICEKFIIF